MDLSEEILKDLKNEGYSGEELQKKCKYIQSKIPAALETMIQDQSIRIEADLDDYLNRLPDEEDE